MCGITGGIAQRDVTPILIEGLRRLEYRGYDSAGISVMSNGKIERVRICGKVEALVQALAKSPISGMCGVAHTRWATHGKPDERNAHPHMSGQTLSLVHNGIIENYQTIKNELEANGCTFDSETDSEAIAHLVKSNIPKFGSLLKALQASVLKLQGAYALAMIDKSEPDSIVVARHGSPLVIGLGFSENFVASDILALLPVTQRFIILEDGDVAQVFKDSVVIYDVHGREVQREVRQVKISAQNAEKGTFRHFMQKEIFEQPEALLETLSGRLYHDRLDAHAFGEGAPAIFAQTEQLHITACGTSFHAGLVAAQWIENHLSIPVRVEIASEMRHKRQVSPKHTLLVTLSQSGETADTLAALKATKNNPNYLASLCICNVPESSLVRESDLAFLTHAGPEIGVCSTKAFTTQLLALLLLCFDLAKAKQIDSPALKEAMAELAELPALIQQALSLDAPIRQLAESFADKEHALFLGRGLLYPIAKEGALKLKEISYIHAESYPAGELKHGPLALVDKDMPVVALACNDHLLDKLKSNLEEVKARHGQLIVFATEDACMSDRGLGKVIELPTCTPTLAPLVLSIPMQLLAYHVALIKGTDVDQPRNLAKSVTVE